NCWQVKPALLQCSFPSSYIIKSQAPSPSPSNPKIHSLFFSSTSPHSLLPFNSHNHPNPPSMGTCASSHVTTRPGGGMNFLPSAKVVQLDGRLQEFRRRITAAEVLSLHPNCYLCSSDTMAINSTAPQLPEDHVLQFGQIYFLTPLSKSHTPLSSKTCVLLPSKPAQHLAIILALAHFSMNTED
ncbi:hypothetical protein Pfo_002725, partial [Paulownia fortunei]